MKKPPHTERRGGQWWFRRRVPDQLVPIIGRAEFRESLRTSDMGVARTRAAFRDDEVAIGVEKAKAALRQQQVAPLQLDELTPEEQQYVRDRVRAHVLEEDDAVRMARPDDETREVYEGLLADQYEDASRGLRTGGVVIGRFERERMAKLLALALRKALGATAERQPQIFWQAIEVYSPQLARALEDDLAQRREEAAEDFEAAEK